MRAGGLGEVPRIRLANSETVREVPRDVVEPATDQPRRDAKADTMKRAAPKKSTG